MIYRNQRITSASKKHTQTWESWYENASKYENRHWTQPNSDRDETLNNEYLENWLEFSKGRKIKNKRRSYSFNKNLGH